MILVTPVRPAAGVDRRARLRRAPRAADARWSTRSTSRSPRAGADQAGRARMPPASNTTPADYDAHGREGQGVHPRRRHLPGGAEPPLRGAVHARPFALYRSLRRINPSPFLFYLNFGDFQLAGSSPEILVRLRDGKITIRPIAGTRPRGADARGGPGAGGGAARRSQGARRAPDAARPRPQRRRPRGHAADRHASQRSAVRVTELLRRALQPRHAHRLQRRGRRAEGLDRSTC